MMLSFFPAVETCGDVIDGDGERDEIQESSSEENEYEEPLLPRGHGDQSITDSNVISIDDAEIGDEFDTVENGNNPEPTSRIQALHLEHFQMENTIVLGEK